MHMCVAFVHTVTSDHFQCFMIIHLLLFTLPQLLQYSYAHSVVHELLLVDLDRSRLNYQRKVNDPAAASVLTSDARVHSLLVDCYRSACVWAGCQRQCQWLNEHACHLPSGILTNRNMKFEEKSQRRRRLSRYLVLVVTETTTLNQLCVQRRSVPDLHVPLYNFDCGTGVAVQFRPTYVPLFNSSDLA